MNPYEMRMRCLEAASRVCGDAYSTLRCAVAYENHVLYGFQSGIATLDAVTSPGERGQASTVQTPAQPEDPQPDEDDRAGNGTCLH